jgi:uncharacterized protein YbjT (DUF2867 family)
MAKTALIAGASGLVGSFLLRRLAAEPDYRQIVAVARRPLPVLPKVRTILTPLDRLPELRIDISIDDVFCCLGTTIKAAGTVEAVRKVDFDAVLAVAKLGLSRGAGYFGAVSSVGANPRSLAWYTRVKGDMESAISQLGYGSVAIVRPSIISGPRQEFRLAESLVNAAAPMLSLLLVGRLKRYRPITAETIAATLYATAQQRNPGVRYYESDGRIFKEI